MRSFDDGLNPEIGRVRAIRDTIRKRLRSTPDTTGVDERDLADIGRTLSILEYLLSKYQEKRGLCLMLEGIRDAIRQAADGVTAADEEIRTVSAISEESCRRIQETRLSMHSSPDPADRESVRRILDQTGRKNFTPAANKADNEVYKQSGGTA